MGAEHREFRMDRSGANRFVNHPATIWAALVVVFFAAEAVFSRIPYFVKYAELRTTWTAVVMTWASCLFPVRFPKAPEIRGVGAEPDPHATWVRSFPGSVLVLALVVSFFAHRWLEAQGFHPVLVGTLAALPAIVLLCAPRYGAAAIPTARAAS
jgi:hypothetical protein